MKRVILILLACSCFAQEIKRPGTDTDSGNQGCIGTRLSSSAMPQAYDAAGLSTESDLSAGGTQTASNYRARNFSGWTTNGNSYLSLTLNVNSSASPSGPVQGCIAYSIDGGVTFTHIRCDSGSGWTQRTDTISLSASQDLTQIEIEVCVAGLKNPGGKFSLEDISIYDIWTSGSTTPQSAGNGSGAGQPHRGLVTVN